MKPVFKALPASLALFSILSLTGCNGEAVNEQYTGKPSNKQETKKNIPEYETLSVLADFDDVNLDLSAENANYKMVDADDGKALQIEFLNTARFSGIHLDFETPQDWTKYNEYHVALDVENTGDESIQLFLSINSDGSELHRHIAIPTGEKMTIFAPVDGIFWNVGSGFRENPKPWSTDELMFILIYGNYFMSNNSVSRITLNTRTNMTNKHLRVDNIRLRKNQDYDETFLHNIVDQFGQNANVDFPTKVNSMEEFRTVSDKEIAALEKSKPLADRSRFGGWKDGPKLEGTGFFRAEKVEGKWWMVDPDGYLFFSNGVANVRLANMFTVTGMDFKDESIRYRDPEELTPEDSIGAIDIPDDVLDSRYLASDVRRNMFNWLPEHDDPLGNHYSYRRSFHGGPLPHGETFSFYRANLERKFGETTPDSFLKDWQDETLARMQDWGFTSMGNWVDPAFYPNGKVPYFANGWIIGDFKEIKTGNEIWHAMPDVFDPEFERRADLTIAQIAKEIKGSPWCVGIFVDNEKTWGYRTGPIEHRYFLPVAAMGMDAKDSPAKDIFSKFLVKKYQTIDALNDSWDTDIQSFDAMKKGVTFASYNENLEADLSEMLLMLSNRYFKVVHDALEKVLPNHLYMGVRMATWGMPQETIEAATTYTDVLSFNVYDEGLQPFDWEFLREVDLPAVIGEFHVGAISDTGLTHPGLIFATDQEDRARKYRVYMDSVSGHDNFVGAHWFQYLDSPLTGRAFDGESYNVGFVNTADVPYPAMVNMAKDFNTSLYPERFNRPLTKPLKKVAVKKATTEAVPN
ncbi:beta-agarase A [Paraglaciecola agarilytica NO2]|uniref:Beta-agarase A n=1 Tax=Paraglaciecola agarilytica NO2 TaxID=1125747 RepID=A0ABQ0IE56_9ALTE|nr:beta-agarase A [Paraglaciecola agarilytica NO2]